MNNISYVLQNKIQFNSIHSCCLVHLNCYLYYYTCTHNWLRNKHIYISINTP